MSTSDILGSIGVFLLLLAFVGSLLQQFSQQSKLYLGLNALGAGLSDYMTGAKDAATTLKDIENAYIKDAKESGLL